MQDILFTDHFCKKTPTPTKKVHGLDEEGEDVVRTRTVLRESVAAMELEADEDPGIQKCACHSEQNFKYAVRNL